MSSLVEVWAWEKGEEEVVDRSADQVDALNQLLHLLLPGRLLEPLLIAGPAAADLLSVCDGS
jgi:hypothetical protein